MNEKLESPTKNPGNSTSALTEMMDWSWSTIASSGAMSVTNEKGEVIGLAMIPEAEKISRESFLELKKQRKIITTWRACGHCKFPFRIEHTPEYNLDELPPCSRCSSQDWQAIDPKDERYLYLRRFL